MRLTGLIMVVGMIFGARSSVAEKVSAGGLRVECPAPEGYVRVDEQNAEFDKSMRAGLPKNYKLLAVFGTKAMREALQTGAENDAPRIFNIQVVQPDVDFSSERFRAMMEQTEAQIDEGIKKLETEMQEATGDGGSAEIVPLGVFGKGENWMTHGMRMTLEPGDSADGVDGAKPKSSELVAVGSMMNLGPKVLAIYGMDSSGNPQAKEELVAEVESWRKAIFAANLELMTNSYTGGFDWSSTGGRLVIWVGIGIGVVILMRVMKRRSG